MCTDTKTEPANCGACGTVCPAGNVCSAGVCALTCQAGLTNCNGLCEDTSNNPAHCGGCGTACPTGDTCNSGICTFGCLAGSTACGGVCVHLPTDNQNCGACGTACPAGSVCSGGACALSCQMGLTICSGTCTSTQSDPSNCGICGKICAAGNVCSAGACALSCQAGLTNCSGSCVNLASDPGNCGVCGKACSLAQASSACSAGACAVTGCTAGFANCDNNPVNGCEINLTNNPSNCGSCGNGCGTPPNTTGATCASSVCGFSCAASFYNQDGQYADGCECAAMAAPTTCGAATAVTAPAVSQGRVLPTGQQSWWAVTFPNENGLCGKHYQIVLVNNGNPIFMNVFQNCTNTGVSCNAPSDAMSNYTTWDWTNSGANCTQAYPTTFFVEVVATASVGTCMDYSVISFIQ